MSSQFEKEAARLAKLPRADRFNELVSFPEHYMFKVIGSGEGFSEAVKTTIVALGYSREIILVERPSSSGRYVSITFQLHVENGADLDRIYLQLEKLPGLAYIL